MPAPPRTASAVAPKVISTSIPKINDPTSVTNFPTTKTKFNYDLGKHNTISDPVLSVLSNVPPPPAVPGSYPIAAPSFLKESTLDPRVNPYHLPPASIDSPSVPVNPPAVSNTPLLSATFPESQHDELDSPEFQRDELESSDIPRCTPDSPPIQHDELDALIQSSVEQFLSSKDWTQFVRKAKDSKKIGLTTFPAWIIQ